MILLDVGLTAWLRLLVRQDMAIDELHRLIELFIGWDEMT